MRRLAVVGVALLASGAWNLPAFAGTRSTGNYVYEVLLDTDDDQTTGGPVKVVQGSEAPHDEMGIDRIVRVFAGADGVGQVTGLSTTAASVFVRQVLAWNAGTMMFEVIDTDTSVYPIGTNSSGHGLVEFGAPLSLVGAVDGWRGIFHASIVGPANDYTAAFRLDGVAAPAVSLLGGAAVVAVLLVSAAVALRRRRTAVGVMAAILCLAATVVWAQIMIDGQFADWAGISPIVGDPAGDSSIGDPAEDILAGYVALENTDVFFRMDLAGVPDAMT
jgi:hypothetical protein